MPHTTFDNNSFENLISRLSYSFINLPFDHVDEKIDESLEIMVHSLGIERSLLHLFSDNQKNLLLSNYYVKPGIKEPTSEITSKDQPYLTRTILNGKLLAIERIDELPQTARLEIKYLKQQGVKSALAIPLAVNNESIGVLTFTTVNYELSWPDYLIKRCRLVGEIFANAIERKNKEQKILTAYSEIKQLKNQLEQENIYLKEKIELEHGHDEIFGKSPAINYVLRQAEQVAKTDSSVLLQGETGTGKELLARSIHNLSSRKKRTMIVVNCGAIPASLIENEIFGREKGAYTGAISKKAGSFEIADGSTLFLDEIGELPLELQMKLLRVIEEREIQRLGSNQIIKINVRVIAASNQDLKKAVSNGFFRMDLYYRLNVFPITMPPLRERREDIPILIWEFVRKFEKSMGKRITTIKKTQLEKLQQYDWPGNVRELRNVVELAMIVTEGKVLNLKTPETMVIGKHQDLDLETVERNHIIKILQKTGWRVKGKSGAAELLGLHPATLFSKMKKLGINRANSDDISSNG